MLTLHLNTRPADAGIAALLQGTYSMALQGWEPVVPSRTQHSPLKIKPWKIPKNQIICCLQIRLLVISLLLCPLELGLIWVVLLTNGKLYVLRALKVGPLSLKTVVLCQFMWNTLGSTECCCCCFIFNLNFNKNRRARWWKKCSNDIWNEHGIIHRTELPEIALLKYIYILNNRFYWCWKGDFSEHCLQRQAKLQRKHVFIHGRPGSPWYMRLESGTPMFSYQKSFVDLNEKLLKICSDCMHSTWLLLFWVMEGKYADQMQSDTSFGHWEREKIQVQTAACSFCKYNPWYGFTFFLGPGCHLNFHKMWKEGKQSK